jgi:hypothetical protein
MTKARNLPTAEQHRSAAILWLSGVLWELAPRGRLGPALSSD